VTRALRASTAAAALAAALAAGCTSAVVADTRLASGREVQPCALFAVRAGDSKGEVLDRLGAPVEVLAPATGDVFVYRLAAVDQLLVQFNSSLVGGPGVPLWAYYDGLAEDAVVFVQFDRTGRVTYVAGRDPRRERGS